MKHIGIVCEGPTDYIILRGVIDQITGDKNTYVMLQPENDLTGKYGNGWKGVWKWCYDNASIRKELMKGIQPALDLLVVQMDGDVSRKEKSSHCWCKTTQCAHKGEWNPLECDITPAGRAACPIVLPCPEHDASVRGYMSHTISKTWKSNFFIWFSPVMRRPFTFCQFHICKDSAEGRIFRAAGINADSNGSRCRATAAP